MQVSTRLRSPTKRLTSQDHTEGFKKWKAVDKGSYVRKGRWRPNEHDEGYTFSVVRINYYLSLLTIIQVPLINDLILLWRTNKTRDTNSMGGFNPRGKTWTERTDIIDRRSRFIGDTTYLLVYLQSSVLWINRQISV